MFIRPSPKRFVRAVFATATAVGLVFGVRALPAQAVAGVGDDAIVVPRGGFRFVLAGLWNDYDAVFVGGGRSTRRPLLDGINSASVGIGGFPQLTAAEAGIRTLSGESAFGVTLGALEARGGVRQSITPISIDYGLTRRLSLRLIVPYVESRDNTQLILNRAGTGANVGANPAFSATAGPSARAQNGALVSQLSQAESQLAADIARCSDGAAAGCEVIRANPPAAAALLARTQGARNAVITVYGDATRGGAPVVPVTGSRTQTAVVNTISALRSEFATYGINAIVVSAAPVAATTILGPGSIASIANDSAWNTAFTAIGNTRRSGIGDVDLTASLLLLDSWGADQRRRLAATAFGVRSLVSVGWRFGSAGADRTEDAFDVPIGDGANALLLRSTTDVVVNRRLWLSATVRAVQPFEDNVAVLLPLRDGARVFPQFNVIRASRTLGRRLELEVAPRVSIGEFFGLSGAYTLRTTSEDRFMATGSTANNGQVLAAAQAVPARTLHAAAFGATFSTLASYARGRSRFAAEVLFTRTMPLSASGGVVPAVVSDRLELRVYNGFPRR